VELERQIVIYWKEIMLPVNCQWKRSCVTYFESKIELQKYQIKQTSQVERVVIKTARNYLGNVSSTIIVTCKNYDNLITYTYRFLAYYLLDCFVEGLLCRKWNTAKKG
jgi:hypothetical protein